MPHTRRGDIPEPPRRCAPYEARYVVVHGYDVPPPAPTAEIPRPAGMVASHRQRDEPAAHG